MRVLVDIAHPAHLHYFRNFTRLFEEAGHEVLFTLRDKGIIKALAASYGLNYVVRSREGNSKPVYAINAIKNIYRAAKEFRPDFFVDMGTIFSAPVSRILRKPHIVFDDTESAHKARALFMPLISAILTPDVFQPDLGWKHIRFDSFMEMFYLHRDYFKKDDEIRSKLGLHPGEKYAVLRFVSWEAHHDKGLSGLSQEKKIDVVREFSELARVFISSESDLPERLKSYRLTTDPALIHSVLAEADLYFGEGATMAMESAILGTPAIYLNQNWPGYTLEAEKRGLMHNYRLDLLSIDNATRTGRQILADPQVKKEASGLSKEYFERKIDPTAFLTWFIEQWPDSFDIMKKSPAFQERFI